MTTTSSPLLGMRELAAALDLSYGYVRRLRSGGGLPAPDAVVDGKPLWLRSTVDAWKKERDGAAQVPEADSD